MQAISSRSVLVALLLTALSGVGFFAVLSMLGPEWTRYAPATCSATRCFCEMPRAGTLILQPANTWSSFGYVLIGSLMLVMRHGRAAGSALPALPARALGVTAIIVGVGSGLLHATLTLWGQFFDVVGMYLVGSFFLISALARWRRIPDGTAMGLYAAMCAVLIMILILLPEVRRWLFAVLLIVAIVAELGFARRLRSGARVGLYLGGILATTVAFAIWILDQTGAVCAPHSLLQGHAVWHLLGALSLWLTFSYYRSERASGGAIKRLEISAAAR
jgi:hypothetical protein